jgi:ABC-type transport system involved in cytochrome bd biosynthesis fused ATPase/permease subunit
LVSKLRLRYLGPLVVLVLAAVVVTLVEGTPDRLPAVALGSTVLLHVLRAGALFAIGFVVATVVARAGAGRLPTQLSTSGIGYDAEETRATTTALAQLQEQVDDQQAALDRLAEQLDALKAKP